MILWQRPCPNPRHSILADNEPLGFDLSFAHGPTLHFHHYVGQSGSSRCPSTPTNATYKSCKHSTTKLVLCIVLAVIWTTILTSLLHCNIILNHFVNKRTIKLHYCSALPFLSRILHDMMILQIRWRNWTLYMVMKFIMQIQQSSGSKCYNRMIQSVSIDWFKMLQQTDLERLFWRVFIARF